MRTTPERDARASSGAPSPARRTPGFTVVELVVVLALTGILAAVMAPRFFSRRGFDADFYAEDVLDALRYAQKLAVASGCDVQVTLGPGGYALAERQTCLTGSFSVPVPQPGGASVTYARSTPSGVSLSSPFSSIVFDPLGRAHDGSQPVDNASVLPNDGSVIVTVGGHTLTVIGETGFVYG